MQLRGLTCLDDITPNPRILPPPSPFRLGRNERQSSQVDFISLKVNTGGTMALVLSHRNNTSMTLSHRVIHAVIVLLTVLSLVGCRPELPPKSVPESAPLPASNDQITRNDVIEEAAPPTRNTPANADVPTHITPELHARFVRGISTEEARRLLAITPEVVGGDGENTIIYRGEDGQGAYFRARVEAGHLVMCSRLRQHHAPPKQTAQPPTITMGDGSAAAQVAPGVYVPLERAIASSMAQPRGVTAPTPPLTAPKTTVTSENTEGRKAHIVVSGATRRERQRSNSTGKEPKRSYTPHAKLPEFSHSLHQGRYEIRFLNPDDTALTIGLRQNKRGQDLNVAPKGQVSFKVDRGLYELYFLRDDDPGALYEAPPITIDGIQNTDIEVHLNPDDIQIRPIDYAPQQ